MNNSSSTLLCRARLAIVSLALAGLAACAQPFNAKVSRFQSQLPAPQGQTFAVVADDPALTGGLEFSQYSQLVSAQMEKQGYTAAAPEAANLLVRFDYGVDKGRERVRASGFRHDPFWSPWYGFGRYPYWGSYYRPRGMWGYGWYDPFFDEGYESYTVYTSGVNMKIDRRADGQRLFEGKAEAASTSNRLQYLVPNLVEAMFTGFPGNSGETVRISIAPEKKKKD
jgi:hypothetical protein